MNPLLMIKTAVALTTAAAKGAKAFNNPQLAAKLGQISEIAGMAGIVSGAAGDIAKTFKDPTNIMSDDPPSWLNKKELTESPLTGSGLKIGELGKGDLAFNNKALQIAPNLETALESLGENTAFKGVGDVLAGGWKPSDKDYPVFKTRY